MSRPEYTYDDAVEHIAKRYGVPRSVYTRMVGQESGGSDSAVSPKGASSRWQIMPATAKGLGIDASDPLQAAEGGLRILRNNYKRFRKYAQNDKHAWMMAVAGYHTNPDNVLKDIKSGGMGLPMTSDGMITTRDHVLKIFDGLKSDTLDRNPFGIKYPTKTPPENSTSSDAPDSSSQVSIGDEVQDQYLSPDEMKQAGVSDSSQPIPVGPGLPKLPGVSPGPTNPTPQVLKAPPPVDETQPAKQDDQLPVNQTVQPAPSATVPTPRDKTPLESIRTGPGQVVDEAPTPEYQEFLKHQGLADSPENRKLFETQAQFTAEQNRQAESQPQPPVSSLPANNGVQQIPQPQTVPGQNTGLGTNKNPQQPTPAKPAFSDEPKIGDAEETVITPEQQAQINANAAKVPIVGTVDVDPKLDPEEKIRQAANKLLTGRLTPTGAITSEDIDKWIQASKDAGVPVFLGDPNDSKVTIRQDMLDQIFNSKKKSPEQLAEELKQRVIAPPIR
jgi:hypothetical protein